jgi:2-polyprenyl-6-methoxyphenol hydroxylase-like FAD-dependent oxidoreductase
MSAASSECDVLVAGAGPTGLTLAAELTRHGVNCRLIDKCAHPCDNARATNIHSRTLEIFEHQSISRRFTDLGHHTHAANTWTEGMKRLHYLSFWEIDSPFPFVLTMGQNVTEQLLGDFVRELGKTIERPLELTGFEQDADGVTANLRHLDGRAEQVRCRYLVGCDGAHSCVRHTLNLPLIGTSYPQDFQLGDVRIDWDLPYDEFHFFVRPGAYMAAFPLPNQRWLLVTDHGMAHWDQPLRGQPTLADLQAMMDDRGPPGAKVSDPIWLAYFRTQNRQVERYRHGRVFLAGDAAHIQSPVGGKGMNTGIQDAFNLGWKLALVVQGSARQELLDSYHVERHQAGQETLIYSDRMHHAQIFDRAPTVSEAIRKKFTDFISSFEAMQQRQRRSLAELNVAYRHSPAVAEHRAAPLHLPGRPGNHAGLLGWHDFGAGPHAGDRALDARLQEWPSREPLRLFNIFRGSTRHHLFLLEGAHSPPQATRELQAVAERVRSRYGRWIDIHLVMFHPVQPLSWEGPLLLDADGEMHHRYGARYQCLYLVRPDDYIGFRSQPAEVEPLLEYLGRIFV